MFGLKLDTKLDYYVFFLIIIKCIFVVAALGHVVLTHTTSSFNKYDAKFTFDGNILIKNDLNELQMVNFKNFIKYNKYINYEK